MLADPAQSEMADGARDLIASAAKQSRAKLEFARLAYGASSTSGTDIDTRECERVARILFEIEKADLEWDVPLILLPKHKAKALHEPVANCGKLGAARRPGFCFDQWRCRRGEV
ncbi:hypothetical protein PSQ19_09555 [Devosia algicola]|uniref:Uncharacterized protein n=1 Tax=Devosia algicola TaxID=3026418 RepID=A0ABY7YS80_9HYPH|nr:hypothetical protein [Devosia algicola]WDR04203.1 hypothetical protein PSQ19_09555 [Devosia algicola]